MHRIIVFVYIQIHWSCPQVMKKQGQLTNQIKKLQYQLSYSQHINKQLSAQLATMCTKLGIAPNKYKQTSDIALINSTTHLQQLYYLQPLLMCYEEIIHLLKGEIEEAKEEAKVIQENVENVVGENGFLRKELQAKIGILVKAENLGLNVNFMMLENRDLRDKISILNSKNEYLVRKNKQIDESYQKLKKHSLSLFDKSTLQSSQQSSKQALKQRQTKLIHLQTQLQLCQNRLQNQLSITSQHETKISEQQNQILRLKNQLKVTKQQLQNNITLHQRIKQNLENQNIVLKDQLAVSVKKQQQMFMKNMSVESELQDNNNKIHNANVQNSQLQANNNNMLQMLESYEVKVSALNKKIKKLQNDAKDNNDHKAQYTKRAQIAQWKLSQKNQQMQRKQAQWRKQKARLTKMWEDRMETMKKTYQLPNTNK